MAGTDSRTGKIDPDAFLCVELNTSHSIVQVKRKKVELSSEEAGTSFQAPEESKKRRKSRSRSKSPSTTKKHDTSKGHHRSHKALKWVTEGILVRVVSKKAFSGKLYNCVLPVSTVLSETTFEVFSREHNRHITELREKDVETALPRSKDIEKATGNRTVIIVRGRYRGASGTVNSIDKKRDKV